MWGDLIEEFIGGKNFSKGDVDKILPISQQRTTRSNGFRLEIQFRKKIGRKWFSNRVGGNRIASVAR